VPDDLVLTPLEVARLLRVSDVTVRRMITRGILPRIAGVRIVLIPRSAVDCLLLGEYDVASDGSRQGPGNDRPEQDAERRGSVADRRQEPDWDGLLKAMNDAQLKADEALAEFRRIVEGAGR